MSATKERQDLVEKMVHASRTSVTDSLIIALATVRGVEPRDVMVTAATVQVPQAILELLLEIANQACQLTAPPEDYPAAQKLLNMITLLTPLYRVPSFGGTVDGQEVTLTPVEATRAMIDRLNGRWPC